MPLVLIPSHKFVLLFIATDVGLLSTGATIRRELRYNWKVHSSLKIVFCQLSWRWCRCYLNLIHLADDDDLAQLRADSG